MGDIPGWYSFRKWYEELAKTAPDGSTLVELGVFCGKSLAHLAELCGGRCRVVGVDTFLGSPEFAGAVRSATAGPFEQWAPGALAGHAVGHLHAAGVLGDVTLVVSDSAKAAQWFADGSVYAVMVDAGHDADSVERDIRAWWPKLCAGGWMGFDDFSAAYPGVREGIVRVLGAEGVPELPQGDVSVIFTAQKTGATG